MAQPTKSEGNKTEPVRPRPEAPAQEAAAAKDPIISPEKDDLAIETAKCAMSPGYFINTYLKIDDPNRPGQGWFGFVLWPAQREAIKLIAANDKVVCLKARQLGLSWLSLGYALWKSIFKPGSVTLLFSKNSDDAHELMRRVRGMWSRLPNWLKPEAEKELEKELVLKLGDRTSRIKSFTTTKHAGRSYTASLVIIDEAAFIPFLDQLMNAAEETADAGGQLIVISTNDKEKPNNGFATLYKRAVKGTTDYKPLFIPWYGRPMRDRAWYEHKKRTKRQDDLWQEYPEIPAQALAGLSATKRFDPEWLRLSTRDDAPLSKYGMTGLPRLPGITYYAQVVQGRDYLIVIDPAEGDITSDPTAIVVFDTMLWEEVAFMQGAYEPGVAAGFCYRLASAFNNAVICPERNNHGHAVILSLRQFYEYKWIYKSPFDKKLGWLTSHRTKTLAMDKLAELMEFGEFGIKSKIILAQLANIDATTQEAPEGEHDDAAMVAIIAAAALTWTTIRKKTRRRRLVSVSM